MLPGTHVSFTSRCGLLHCRLDFGSVSCCRAHATTPTSLTKYPCDSCVRACLSVCLSVALSLSLSLSPPLSLSFSLSLFSPSVSLCVGRSRLTRVFIRARSFPCFRPASGGQVQRHGKAKHCNTERSNTIIIVVVVVIVVVCCQHDWH